MIRGDVEVGTGYDLIKKLASLGLTQRQIADMLCFSERTLRNRLREDERAAEAYAAGRAEITYEIANRHRQIALHGSESESRRACEFWLERQFGWVKPRQDMREVEEARPRVLAVPMPMTVAEWEASALANEEALRELTAREVEQLPAVRDPKGDP